MFCETTKFFSTILLCVNELHAFMLTVTEKLLIFLHPLRTSRLPTTSPRLCDAGALLCQLSYGGS